MTRPVCDRCCLSLPKDAPTGLCDRCTKEDIVFQQVRRLLDLVKEAYIEGFEDGECPALVNGEFTLSAESWRLSQSSIELSREQGR